MSATLDGLLWPEGDAGALAAAAASAARARSMLGSLGSSLTRTAAAPTGWRGAAATAFRDTIETELRGLDRSAAALREAVAALRRLAEVVRDAQEEVRRLASEVREAEAAAVAAQSRALSLGSGIDAALALAASPEALPRGERASEASADRADAAATRARGHADEVRARAMRRAEQVCDELRRVDAVTARAVERAAALAPSGGRRHPTAATPAHAFWVQAFSGLSREESQQLAYFLAQPSRPDLDRVLHDYQVQSEGEPRDWEPPWPLNQFTDPERLTAKEIELIETLSLMKLKSFRDIRNEAREVSEHRYGGKGAEDGHEDAFRHAYWNALMTRRLGETFARKYATAHETVPNPASREAMDLYNNERGRSIALEHPDASPEELASLIQQAIDRGDMVVIDRDHKLQWSDRVGVGETGLTDGTILDGGVPAEGAESGDAVRGSGS